MKRILFLALTVLLAAGCYDDAALWDQIKNHEGRISKLETLCNQMNTNISSLQTIVSALQNNDYVTNVAPITENGKEIGYTVTFSKSGSITIYHGNDGENGKDGADGKDGSTPVIGVKMASDGVYYWTIDGEWLLDSDGNKIPTTGKDGADGQNGENGQDGADGITPQLKIEEDYWYISYDNGQTWNQLGKAVGEDGKDGVDGDSMFSSVVYEPLSWYLKVCLADGETEFMIPIRSSDLSLLLRNAFVVCKRGETVTVEYTVWGANDGLDVTTLSEGGYHTSVRHISRDKKNKISKGEIVVSTNESSVSGRVVVFATNSEGVSAIETIEFTVGPDLSESESSNSYIVSSTGTYIFTPVKGNSTESLAEMTDVQVLWESFGTDVVPEAGSLVSDVHWWTSENLISFDVPYPFKEGNALIAAKDKDGNVLWSWHIWLTDEPQEQVYFNDAGTMMDRNLGATSATPSDVGALGLLYQWGRKDPFLNASSIGSEAFAASTAVWPESVVSDMSTGTIEFSIQNPMTYITRNDLNQDWNYTGSSIIDVTRWTSSDSKKSIYDPCPAGWRVPDGNDDGVWAKAAGFAERHDHPYDEVNAGMEFSGVFGDCPSIWYPNGNHITPSPVDFKISIGNGYYNSATIDAGNQVNNLYLSRNGYFIPARNSENMRLANSLARGCSVRCVKE